MHLGIASDDMICRLFLTFQADHLHSIPKIITERVKETLHLNLIWKYES